MAHGFHKMPFHKMEGLGNDFAIFDAREEPLAMSEALARALADRHKGIGCDQLIVLEPSDTADVRMRIWNHDGGEVESCGNAARCVVALTGATSIETDGGLVSGAADGSEVEVAIGEPRFGWDEVPLAYAMDTAALPMAWGELEMPTALSVGNPHLVFFVEDAEAIPLEGLGPLIEHDPAFPDRINVSVAQVGGGGIRLRTWERGAGLTLACGTGACAAAVAAIASRRAQSPVKVTMPGGSLTIAWQPGEPVRMRGPATYVFRGEIDLEKLTGGSKG
ncbi:MAG TPA: diaminopimelate epimerase [Sphingomicrobium sp.]|nr:diaminopimelate epimerase [Sphingomicrobium sp.]